MAVSLTIDGVTYSNAATGSGSGGPLADAGKFTYQTLAPASGRQAVQFWIGGSLKFTLTLDAADATALGTALGGTGGVAAAAKLP